MKPSTSSNVLKLLLAVSALTASHGMAQTTTTYSPGNLLLGFRQIAQNSDYLVNIGPVSALSSTTTFSLGDIATDLGEVFGPGWATDSQVFWSVSGSTGLFMVGSDPTRTLYATRQDPPGGSAIPWNTAASQGATDGKMQGMATAYKGKLSSANSPVGLIQNNIDTALNNAYASYQPGGGNTGSGNLAFGYFNPSIEGNSASGIASTSLGFFRMQQMASTPATRLGTFTISSSGVLTFTLASNAYASWIAGYPSLTGNNALDTADPDHDGMTNCVEFILGSDPTKSGDTNRPGAALNAGNLVFSYPRNGSATALYDAIVQTSTDLVHWTDRGAGTGTSVYSVSVPTNGEPSIFARLKVTKK